MQVFKRTGHGVFAADGRNAKADLCVQRTEQSTQRLAPAHGVVAKALKIFLEGQVSMVGFQARCHKLCHTFHHGEIRAVIRALLTDKRVKAPRHCRTCFRFAVRHRQLCHHGLRGGHLRFSAEGHQHGACADGGVEALRKALFTAHIQLTHQVFKALCKAFALAARLADNGFCHHSRSVLFRAVGVQKFARDIADDFVIPAHDKARRFCDDRHYRGFKVLGIGKRNKALCFICGHHDGHALLAFRNSKFGAVQALVFFRHGVEVNFKAVCQLADGDGHSSRAEVVAALDEQGCLFCAEQTLQLALDGRIALLHLCAAGFKAFGFVCFGRTRCTAAAVTARASAQQDNHVAGLRFFTAHILLRHCAHHCADFHALCHIARVIPLVYLSRGKADLVAVAGITRGSRRHQLALGQFAGNGFLHGLERVARAGHAHRLIYIAAVGQGVADRAADAGGRAAEGLNFRGVVVRFVFKEQQPRLVYTVIVHGNAHAASVDFVRFIEILQNTFFFEVLAADGAEVHQAHGLIFSRVNVRTQFEIILVRSLNHGVADVHIVQNGAKSSVAAMVGPVGVNHADFRNGRVALFGAEILLTKGNIALVHRQPQPADQLAQCRRGQLAKALQGNHIGRHGVFHGQRLLCLQQCLARLHGVDDVFFNFRHFRRRRRAAEQVNARIRHCGALTAGCPLNTFSSAGCALVKLAGQKLRGKHHVALGNGRVG